MAHEGLTTSLARSLALPVGLCALVACGDAPRVEAPTAAAGPDPARAFEDLGAWPAFHSKRFQLSVPMPDGHGWRIDDHRQRQLVATHAPTRSRIEAWAGEETELVNRQRCEARVRELGLAPRAELDALEDAVATFPEAYDSRIVVALERARPKQPLVGHVLLFGGFLRRCLFVRFSSEVASPDEAAALSTRLAAARARIVGKVALDPPRVRSGAEVPRDKPVPPPAPNLVR
jgi:hypothetical protein